MEYLLYNLYMYIIWGMYNIHCIYGKVRGPPRSACMVVLYVSHVSATTSVNKADLWKLEEVAKDEAVHSDKDEG